MSCVNPPETLDAYVDGELTPDEARAVERHLAGCAACRALRAEIERGVAMVKVNADHQHAPAALRARIESGVAKAGAARRAAASAEIVLLPPRRGLEQRELPRARVTALAASFVIGAMVTSAAALYLGGPNGSDRLVPELVSSHARALLPGHLFDVESSDEYTVRPWFSGKLDYVPPVADFARQGFALTGARLDYVAGRNVAALTYRHDRHVIDLYIWPSGSAGPVDPSIVDHAGFRIAHWGSADWNCWAISDLSADELRAFAEVTRRSFGAARSGSPDGDLKG